MKSNIRQIIAFAFVCIVSTTARKALSWILDPSKLDREVVCSMLGVHFNYEPSSSSYYCMRRGVSYMKFQKISAYVQT